MGSSDRRQLLKVLGASAAAASIPRRAQGAEATETEQWVARFSDLEVAAPILFSYPDEGAPSLLVRLAGQAVGGVGPDESVVAFSRICPHLGCSMTAKVTDGGMLGPCACHFSCFDLKDAGAVIQGPASQNIAQIRLELRDDDIFAVGVDGLIYGRHQNFRGSM